MKNRQLKVFVLFPLCLFRFTMIIIIIKILYKNVIYINYRTSANTGVTSLTGYLCSSLHSSTLLFSALLCSTLLSFVLLSSTLLLPSLLVSPAADTERVLGQLNAGFREMYNPSERMAGNGWAGWVVERCS